MRVEVRVEVPTYLPIYLQGATARVRVPAGAVVLPAGARGVVHGLASEGARKWNGQPAQVGVDFNCTVACSARGAVCEAQCARWSVRGAVCDSA